MPLFRMRFRAPHAIVGPFPITARSVPPVRGYESFSEAQQPLQKSWPPFNLAHLILLIFTAPIFIFAGNLLIFDFNLQGQSDPVDLIQKIR